ncbi:hypothetical protein [Emcibacter sp.]|uniref:hypothetical protein n=1 Tax=Emcibacter sp. TaxID=1979954 RepID=UPI003A8F9C13
MTFRASLRAHIMLGLTLGGGIVLLLFLIIAFMGKEVEEFWTILAPLGVWFILVQLWVGGHCISLSSNEIRYRSLLRGWKSLKREEIDRGIFRVKAMLNHLAPWSSENIPPYSLALLPVTHLGKDAIVINMRMFKFREMQEIRTWLGDKAEGELNNSLFEKGKELPNTGEIEVDLDRLTVFQVRALGEIEEVLKSHNLAPVSHMVEAKDKVWGDVYVLMRFEECPITIYVYNDEIGITVDTETTTYERIRGETDETILRDSLKYLEDELQKI